MGSDTEIGLRAEIHRLEEMVDGYKAAKRGATARMVDLTTRIVHLLHERGNKDSVIDLLQKRCEVADRGLVNYEQWCCKIKELCGGDMSKNNISDTIEVVERRIGELREKHMEDLRQFMEQLYPGGDWTYAAVRHPIESFLNAFDAARKGK